MELNVGKWYRTRDGRKVIIYALNGMDPFPVHGAILTEDGWAIRVWNRDGYDWNSSESPKDIVGVWMEPPSLGTITPGMYRTRDGQQAVVYYVTDRGDYPLHGIIFDKYYIGVPFTWDKQGKSGRQENYDLVERI